MITIENYRLIYHPFHKHSLLVVKEMYLVSPLVCSYKHEQLSQLFLIQIVKSINPTERYSAKLSTSSS